MRVDDAEKIRDHCLHAIENLTTALNAATSADAETLEVFLVKFREEAKKVRAKRINQGLQAD